MGVTLYKITHTRPVHKRHVLKNYTDKVIKALTPEIRKGMVTVKDCVIFGKKRSGKTYLEKSIAEKIVENYGEDNVSVYMSDSFSALAESLDKPTTRCGCGAWNLFENGSGICKSCNEPFVGNVKDKKVKVLIVDDPLKRYLSRGGTTKEQREAIGDYEAIAHRLEKKLEIQEGVVIIIIGSQQYKGLEKTFRDAPILIFKTTMEDDQWVVNRKLNYNQKAIQKLREVTDDVFIKDKHDRRSENIVKVGEKVGYCTFPPCEKDYTVFIEEKKARDKRRQATELEIVVCYAREVLDETTLMGKDTRAIVGFLIQKHPDKVDEIVELRYKICAVVDYERKREREEISKVRSSKSSEKEKSVDKDNDNIKLKKDKNGFVWDYWKERDRLKKILLSSKNMEEVDVECLLRTYELWTLGDVSKVTKRPARTQEDVANTIVEEGLRDRCSQQVVSKWNSVVKGEVEYQRGVKYELYLKNRLKKEVIEGLFDIDKVKEIIHLGSKRSGTIKGNYPDLIIVYENGDIDVVSCKCFNDMVYDIPIMSKKCSVIPERDAFLKLYKGKEVHLPNDITLRKEGNVRLVLMLKSTHKQLPYEVYIAFSKPVDLPAQVCYNESAVKKHVFKIAKWIPKKQKRTAKKA